MTKTKSRLFGLLFIVIFIACVFFTLTPIAKAEQRTERVDVAQQTPVPDRYDTDTQMNPNVDPQYNQQPGFDMDTDTQYNEQPGAYTDNETVYDDDVEAGIDSELMTQQQANAQSILLWVLVALGFIVVAVLITISIIRNRDRDRDRYTR